MQGCCSDKKLNKKREKMWKQLGLMALMLAFHCERANAGCTVEAMTCFADDVEVRVLNSVHHNSARFALSFWTCCHFTARH
jgi:hypothetical protein